MGKKGFGGNIHQRKLNTSLCSSKFHSNYTCTYCGKAGYINMFCRMKQKVLDGKFQWIPKQGQNSKGKEKCFLSIVDNTQSIKGVKFFTNPLFETFEKDFFKD